MHNDSTNNRSSRGKGHTGRDHTGEGKAPRRPARMAKPHMGAVRTDKMRRDEAPRAASSKKPARPRVQKPAGQTAHDDEGGQRIAKVMARAGLCSRRDAEAWINEGRVTLNGTVLTNPAVNVSDNDKVLVDGTPLAHRERTRLFLFHKPRGLVTTEHDPEGRPTIFDYLHEHWHPATGKAPRVISIGRLDINTEGLLLLTNDGGLARVLELPTTGWVRRYRVRAKGETDQSVLDRLRDGITIDGVEYAGIEAVLDREQGANSWLTMSLREGKNREVKRVLEHIGLVVNRLIRLSFGPFQLGDLPEGAVEEVRTRVLRDQLGPTLTEAAGADFLSPIDEDVGGAEYHEMRKAPRHEGQRAEAGQKGHAGKEGKTWRSEKPRSGSGARMSRPREPEPEVKPKLVRPAPGPRKHISALRAEDTDGAEAPRKRIERQSTEDRKGRKVAIERLVTVDHGAKREAPASRNARHFAALHAAERAAQRAAGGEQRRHSARPSAAGPDKARPKPEWQKPAGARTAAAPKSQFTKRRPDDDGARPATGRVAKPKAPGRAKPQQALAERPFSTRHASRPMASRAPARSSAPRSPAPKPSGGKPGKGRPRGKH